MRKLISSILVVFLLSISIIFFYNITKQKNLEENITEYNTNEPTVKDDLPTVSNTIESQTQFIITGEQYDELETNLYEPIDPILSYSIDNDLMTIFYESGAESTIHIYDTLVLVKDIDPTIIIELRYTTENNFTGKVIYTDDTAFLSIGTALKLKEANDYLRQQGYKIKLWDGYRSVDAQKILWDNASDKRFVADPKKPSQHNFGISVDVTLCNIAGDELEMPTGFDDFSENAYINSTNMSDEARKNLDILQEAMTKSGFGTINIEWWHFNDLTPTSKSVPKINN